MTNKQFSIINLLIAVFAAVLAFVGFLFIKNQYDAKISYINIPVPVTDISENVVITSDMIKTVAMPVAIDDLNLFVTDPSLLYGEITNGKLVSDAPIPVKLISSIDEYRLVESGYQVLTIPINYEYSNGGFIQQGQYVDLYLGHLPNNENSNSLASVQKLGSLKVVMPLTKDGEIISNINNSVIGDTQISNINYHPAEMLMVAIPPNSVPYLLQSLTLSELNPEYILFITLSDVDSVKDGVIEFEPILENTAESGIN